MNVTPDSFSDGGAFLDARAAARHARQSVQDGTDILDFGAEATSFFRTGVQPVPPAEQLRRLVPVLELLHDLPGKVVLSADTRSAHVAREVLKAGVHVINDVSAGTHDPLMLHAVADAGAAIILMHISPSFPATPSADDPDIVATVRHYLAQRVHAAMAAGIHPERIAVDPGVGFGKTMADNWRLALRANQVKPPGFTGPVVLGASRKRFLETPPPPDVPLPSQWPASVADLQKNAPHPRDGASAALTALAARNGVAIHRIHNVELAQRAIKNSIFPL